MLSTVRIDRDKVAEYLKSHAPVIAKDCDIDVDLEKIESMDGTAEFLGTVTVEIRNIPLLMVRAD